MKIERNWKKEFPGCSGAVRRILEELGHTTVDPIILQVGMRIRLNQTVAAMKGLEINNYGIVLEIIRDSDQVRVAFNYFTSEPIIRLVTRHYLEIEVRCE